MSRNYFRIFGAFTLLLGPALFVPDANSSWSQFFAQSVVLVVIEMVGFGLAFQRRWAALYFSVPLFCYGVLTFFASIRKFEFPVNLFAMIFGYSLTQPLVLTVRQWRQLTWGRRLFDSRALRMDQ